LSEVNFRTCPNCGSTDFVEIAPRQRQCTYCGTTLTLPEPKSSETTHVLVKCPYCGFDNERDNRYCNNCGRRLAPKRDPAVTSMVVTIVGFFAFPIVSAVAGLVLGYKALREARAGGGGSEKLARIAVIVGWIGLASPFCLMMTAMGAQFGYSLCGVLIQMLSDIRGGG
jgi:hypothetical protein